MVKSRTEELKVISDFYDFMLWLVQHVQKFPRQHRYSLGISIEERMQLILSHLIKAKYAANVTNNLNEANVELEILRFQLRMAKDLRIMALKSHGFAAKQLVGIGSQIGGWLNQGKR